MRGEVHWENNIFCHWKYICCSFFHEEMCAQIMTNGLLLALLALCIGLGSTVNHSANEYFEPEHGECRVTDRI